MNAAEVKILYMYFSVEEKKGKRPKPEKNRVNPQHKKRKKAEESGDKVFTNALSLSSLSFFPIQSFSVALYISFRVLLVHT